MLTGGGELLRAVVAPVGYIHASVRSDGNAPRPVQLAGTAARPAKRRQELAVAGVLLNLIRLGVRNIDVVIRVAGDSGRAAKPSLAVPLAGSLAVRVVNLHLLVELVRAVDVAAAVNGNPHGPDKLLAREVADELLGDGYFPYALVGGLHAARAFLSSAEYIQHAARRNCHVSRLRETVACRRIATDCVTEVPGSA